MRDSCWTQRNQSLITITALLEVLSLLFVMRVYVLWRLIDKWREIQNKAVVIDFVVPKSHFLNKVFFYWIINFVYYRTIYPCIHFLLISLRHAHWWFALLGFLQHLDYVLIKGFIKHVFVIYWFNWTISDFNVTFPFNDKTTDNIRLSLKLLLVFSVYPCILSVLISKLDLVRI